MQQVDHAVALVFKYLRLAINFLLLLVIAAALMRLLGYPIPLLRLTEGNLQTLGIFVAGAAYALNR